jgi:PAS domain S-box-containing protein
LAALALAMLLAWVLARKFSASLKGITEQSNRIAALDLTPGPPIGTRLAELQQLSDSLGRMRISLGTHIAERDKALEALRESEARFRTIFEQAAVGVALIESETGRFIRINRRYCDIVGYTVEEMSRLKTFQEITHPDDLQPDLDNMAQLLAGTIREFTMEKRYIHKNGSIVWVTLSVSPTWRPGEAAQYHIAVVEDITGRRQMEEALRKSEETYRLLVENQTDLIVKIDLEGRFHFASPSYCDLFGLSEQDLINRHFMPLVHEDDRESTEAEMKKLFHPPHSAYMEQRAMTRHGWRWLGWQDTAILDESGNVVEILGVGRDITERKQAEAALKESEEKFRTLVEKSPMGISLMTKAGRYRYVNPHFTDIFGYTLEDFTTGREWFEKAFPDPRYRQEVITTWINDQKQSKIGQLKIRTFTVTCKAGTRKEIDFRSVTMDDHNLFVMYEDVTEKMKMERQLQQTQKFEAIGTLAGGIAHDFNNLMMGIQGRASLMALDVDPSHPHREHLAAIEEHIRSAADLTRQLLGFARGGKYEPKPIDINDVLADSATLFGRTRKELTIRTDLKPSPLVVEADRNQLEQVLLNMYVNAWQAMPNGGDLFIGTETIDLEGDAANGYDLKPGVYAKIAITDTGVGMDESTRKRVFDPFFTTKEKSRGTGLGLASAYGIVKNHGGAIHVYSEIARGTTFSIYLPLSDNEAHQEIPEERRMVKGSETVLLVDDEELILEVGQAMLEKLGYRVLSSRNGREAVERIRNGENEIDLVILDMIMPEMDGGKAFERIRHIRPEIPVILSSGYAINGQATDIMERGCNGFIQKPFDMITISQKIRQVLDESLESKQTETE